MFSRTCSRIAGRAIFAALATFGISSGVQAHGPHLRVLQSLCSDHPCPNGLGATGRLTKDAAGDFFGLTGAGGVHNGGTAFKLYRKPGQSRWRYQTIYNFGALSDNTDGLGPYSEAPVMDSAGNMYGTTSGGGTAGAGIFFKLSPNRNGKQWIITVLYNFCSKNSSCSDGGQPIASLTYQGAAPGVLYDGVSPLYGTNEMGGAHNSGVTYSLTPRFGRWREHVLYAFCAEGGSSCTDGRVAFDLTLDAAGNLIGAGHRTFSDAGFLFRLTPAAGAKHWTQTVIHNFCSLANCADGVDPGGIVQDTSGNLFGLTSEGGNTNCNGLGCGVLYKIAPDNSQTVLHEFCSRRDCKDGIFPGDGLLLDSSGALFGVTQGGGHYENVNDQFGDGTVFKWSASGLHTVWTFCEQPGCPEGKNPITGLTADSSGKLFGLTQQGGAHNDGTLFALKP